MATRHGSKLLGKTKPLLRRGNAVIRASPVCQIQGTDGGSPWRAESGPYSVIPGFNGDRDGIRPFQSGMLPSLGLSVTNATRSKAAMSRRGLAAAADLPPHEEIGMPSLSPTMTQGNIATWRKKVGDSIAAGDVLCEIETDKATLEMESMEDGFLAKILLGDGAKDIPVGQAIAIVVESEEDIGKFADFTPGSEAAPSPPPAQEAPAAETPPPQPAASPAPESNPKSSDAPAPPSSSAGRVFASPAAKKLAEDRKVDISQIKGTGPDRRILKADVEEYVAKGPAPAQAAPAPSEPTSAAVPPVEGVNYTDLPNSQIRKIVAQRLLQSKQTIPHYYLTVDVQVDKLADLRKKLNIIQEKAGGKKISINDFVIKAAALALREVPQCNASWTEDFIRQYHNVDVSVAVQTEFGLMVPVVKDADKKGLAAISEDVKRLAEKARENKLKPDEFQGGTFAISNLGMYGVKSFAAIINPPQACILAVGGTETRVVPGSEAGTYAKGTFMSTTLSCDHRVIDGALGAQWLAAFKAYVEDPIRLLL